jgi:hypothetical protein
MIEPSLRNIQRMIRGVHVFGDDLIVPSDEASQVTTDLELFGLKVNPHKSFWTGKFRESCGRDYYSGVDVTPVYMKRKIPGHLADVQGVVSTVSSANQFYWIGFWKTARLLRGEVEHLTGELPSLSKRTQAMGWQSYSNAESFHAWDSNYQRPKLRCLVAVPRRRVDPLEGDPALLKCLRLIGVESSPEHLRTSVRNGSLTLKRRWI